jgi:hypothetical protein
LVFFEIGSPIIPRAWTTILQFMLPARLWWQAYGTASSFLLVEMRVLKNCLPRLTPTAILPNSISWVARTTDGKIPCF